MTLWFPADSGPFEYAGNAVYARQVADVAREDDAMQFRHNSTISDRTISAALVVLSAAGISSIIVATTQQKHIHRITESRQVLRAVAVPVCWCSWFYLRNYFGK